MTRGCNLLAAVMIAASLGTAMAEEPSVRRFTWTAATSECLGDAKSPLCALETFLGCSFGWGCPGLSPGIPNLGIGRTTEAMEYRVISETPFGPEQFSAGPPESYWFRPGQVEIALQLRACPDPRATCPEVPWSTQFFVLKPLPGGWKVASETAASVVGRQPKAGRITRTDSTSPCIGDPKTPLCAVETFIACFVRRQIQLCGRVGASISPSGDRYGATEYRILSIDLRKSLDYSELDGTLVPDRATERVELLLEERACLGQQTVCPESPEDLFLYYVLPSPLGWVLEGWTVVGEEPVDVEFE